MLYLRYATLATAAVLPSYASAFASAGMSLCPRHRALQPGRRHNLFTPFGSKRRNTRQSISMYMLNNMQRTAVVAVSLPVRYRPTSRTDEIFLALHAVAVLFVVRLPLRGGDEHGVRLCSLWLG